MLVRPLGEGGINNNNNNNNNYNSRDSPRPTTRRSLLCDMTFSIVVHINGGGIAMDDILSKIQNDLLARRQCSCQSTGVSACGAWDTALCVANAVCVGRLCH